METRKPDSKDARSQYQRPELKEFGTIAELTATNSSGKSPDGATMGNDKSGI